jgi:uncharacterized protein (DUF1778 family)
MGLRLPPELRELIDKAARLEGMKQGQYCRFVLRERSEEILKENGMADKMKGIEE